jgi:NAD(P)H-dependent FMN reductase
LKLQIIVGSTRPNRNADRVLPWLIERASAHDVFEVEVLDLREWPLPLFAEHVGTIGDWADPTYSCPLVKCWNQKIAEGDAYLVLTPEYNHSLPGELKNAIDSVFASFAFRHKPIACVAYSVGISAGARAVEHLAQITIEAEMVPLRNCVLIPFVAAAFDDGGAPNDATADTALAVMLDDLAWWARVMADARPTQLPPGGVRLQAALYGGDARRAR